MVGEPWAVSPGCQSEAEGRSLPDPSWTFKSVVVAGERTWVEGECLERGLEQGTLLWG